MVDQSTSSIGGHQVQSEATPPRPVVRQNPLQDTTLSTIPVPQPHSPHTIPPQRQQQQQPQFQQMHAGGASSGFALPSSSSKRIFPGPLEPINPFSHAGSPSSTPEDTPLATPTAELQKLSLGVERFARAIEDPGIVGSFSGTVPLPTLSQVHAAAKRRPSKILMEDLSSHPHHPYHHSHNDINCASVSGPTATSTPDDLSHNGGAISLGSLKRAITDRIRHQDAVILDLESNMGQVAQETISDNKGDAKIGQDTARTEKYPDEKNTRFEAFDHLDLDNVDPPEVLRRRKPKGGILSQLLKLQRSEAAAVTAAATSQSPPPSRTPSTTKNSTMVKKTKKGFYYRATSRNNSVTSLKDSAPPSVTTTPRVSPRNSTVFERDPQQQQQKHKSGRSLKRATTRDHRRIHRDIAEILTRQSFLIMMAKSLVLYGAPAHRIEETCALLARKMDVDASFALLPGLMTISFSDPETHTSDTRHLRCSQGMDMDKLAQVHKIALAVLRDESVDEANRELERVTSEPAIFPLWLTLLGWLGSSAFVAPLAFGGGWYDMALAGFCGLMVGVLGVVASRFPVYGNVFEITASILVGFLAKSFGDRVCFEAVALSGVVVLLPGLLLTQAIMELSCRNINSGAVRMFYALMYAFFLGFGLTIGAELWGYVSLGF